jgi:FtsH-binding integral membrane protein
LGYFSGGLGLTALLVTKLRFSRLAYMNPWLLFGTSIGFLIGTMMVNYHQSPVLKHALYAGFVGSIAVSMIPLINMSALPVIFDALFATGFTMGGLGLVAYNAPSE